MPLYEYRCTACDVLFSRTESMAEHSAHRAPACPECGSRAVEPVVSDFFAKTVRKSCFLFERLRDAFRAALDAAATPDLRSLARQMREAVVDAKVAVAEIQDALRRTEQELAVERQRLADAERRGRLAGEIQDQETVAIAERFAIKHRERHGVLEHKLAAQREELSLAQRELDDMQSQLKAAATAQPSTERAWRDIEEAGGTREEI